MGRGTQTIKDQFSAVMGNRRGVKEGDLFATDPTTTDRRELQRLVSLVNQDSFDEAAGILKEHYADIETLPLLTELDKSLCLRLINVEQQAHFLEGVEVMRALGFDPDVENGKLFDEKMQVIFNKNLFALARGRTHSLLQKGMPLTELVGREAYAQEFRRIGGSQCFQKRGYFCKKILGSSTVPPNLVEPSAWHAFVGNLAERLRSSGSLEPEELPAILRSCRATDKRVEPPKRRKQRYVF